MKKLKNDNGNILLEVLLMLAIMFVVFPIIQKNVKERSDTLRNQLVVKDMMKLKTATENYLKLKPDIAEGVHLVDFAKLEENGLPKNFKNSNIIGQNYRVKMRNTRKSDGNVEYDAIIIADGNSEISDMRIRDIVKESKGYGGYLEDGIIYGTSWSLDGSGWGENWATPPLIFKVGFAKKDYQYISRNGIGSSTMQTDLFMNLNDIEMVNDFIISKGIEDSNEGIIEVNDLYLSPSGNADISILSIDEELNLNSVMDSLNATVAFPNGINQNSVSIDDTTTSNVYLHSTLKVLNNLSTSFTEENVVSFSDVMRLSVVSSVDMVVGGLIKTPELSTIVAEFGNVDLSSINIDAKYSDTQFMNYKDTNGTMYQAVGFVFNNIYSKFNPSKYNIKTGNNPEVNLSDVIVKRVNQELGIGTRIGNIVITDKTPLSVILRALSYEYADIFRVVENNYNGMIEPIYGLKYDEYYRCAKQTCSGDDSNDNRNWSY
ncbi:hypothetical protein HDR59_02045 [bacterium]|nr:hypothetical protein [bacterium]